MRYVSFDADGKLSIETTTVPKHKSHEVLLKVAAFGVNRADLLQKQGKYPAPHGDSAILGLEAAGTVVECEPHLQEQWLNRRVCALTQGGAYAEYVCIDAKQLIAIPEQVSFDVGASIAEVYLTAFDAIVQTGKLSSSQTLLVHGGASGVGSAAIRLGKQLGAYVITTQSSERKCRYAQKLGADLTINYNQQCFASVMKSKGLKANVIIDPVAGDYLAKNLQVADMDCHCVVLAMLGGRNSNLDMAMLLAKRFNLHGSTLRNRDIEYKRNLVKALIDSFGSLLFSDSMRIPIYKSLDIEHVEQAHAILQKNENLGKVVVSISG
ncbi:NAD(P)H-quinone oxidoreductase [Pseudoalteromonas sp. S16_S37]|uniref:NAD(P)H-quinone oxidoreductase n=1 Tax=Pseudoalteromonas sp. S16_S37 TaxID=2720228 RepID=UPI001680F94E|nr:NAD(P)H-quinone oxidoreductase [Pseudoalteromonas sp. S16_S37]MBD1584149.1 NAD(P)H-quinone oxidoreductase [Pseudoalteromonas sp. S16_S37]